MVHRDRNEGIDILKIVAMLMICMLHFVGKGGLLDSKQEFIQIIGLFFKSFSIVAVNIYVLCSGYLLGNTSFKLKRILRIWIETLTYSVIIYLLCTIKWGYSGILEMIKSLCPVLSMEYWYISAYIILLLLMPVINIAIQNASKKEISLFLMTIVAVFSIWHTIFPKNGLLETGNMQGYGIVWMICLYIIGASIKKYEKDIRINKGILWSTYTIGCLLIFVGQISSRNNHIIDQYNTFFDYNNFIVLVASVSLFLVLKDFKTKSKKSAKWLCVFSTHTLAVYLIQEQYIFKKIYWNWVAEICNQFSDYVVMYLIVVCLMITCTFLSMICIDIIRDGVMKRVKRLKI